MPERESHKDTAQFSTCKLLVCIAKFNTDVCIDIYAHYEPTAVVETSVYVTIASWLSLHRRDLEVSHSEYTGWDGKTGGYRAHYSGRKVTRAIHYRLQDPF